MGNEHGEWIMHGLEWKDQRRIRTADELISFINKIGFLPLFQNDIPGFSVEEHTAPEYWWSGDAEHDPWEWRISIAKSECVAYGKFFNKKAGFISLEWLPYFANYRRDGYDFDSLYEDGRANRRAHKIMGLFKENKLLLSSDIKRNAGFGKGGEKNFDGVVTELQMQTYLVMSDFQRKRNKKGEEYGWPVAVYSMPEQLWSYQDVTAAYKEEPQKSRQRIMNRIQELYPDATEKNSGMLRKI